MSARVAQPLNSSLIERHSDKLACSLEDSNKDSLSPVIHDMSGRRHITLAPLPGNKATCASPSSLMRTSSHTPNPRLKPASDLDTSANPLLSYIGSFTRSLPLPFLPPSIVSMLHQASRPSVVSQHSRIVAKFITSPPNAVWYAPEASQDDSGVYVSTNNELITTLNFPPISASISPIHEVPSLVTSNGLNYSPTTSNIPKLPRTITDVAHWYYDSQRFIQSCYPSHQCLLAVEDKLIETAFGEVISVLGSQQASAPNTSSTSSLLSLQSLNTPSTSIPNSQTLFFDAQRDNTLTMEYFTGRLHAARAISAFCQRTASHDLSVSMGTSLPPTMTEDPIPTSFPAPASVPVPVPAHVPVPGPGTGKLPKSPSRRRLTTEISSVPLYSSSLSSQLSSLSSSHVDKNDTNNDITDGKPRQSTSMSTYANTSIGTGTDTAVTLTNNSDISTDIPPTQRWAHANTQLASLHARLASVSASLDATATLASTSHTTSSTSTSSSGCSSTSGSSGAGAGGAGAGGAGAGAGAGSSIFPRLSSLRRQPSLALARQPPTRTSSTNTSGSDTSTSRGAAIAPSTSLSACKGATMSSRRVTTRVSSSSLAATSGAVARGYGSMAEVATLLNAMHLRQSDGGGGANVRQLHEGDGGNDSMVAGTGIGTGTGTGTATGMGMSQRGSGSGSGSNVPGSEEMCVGVRGRAVITLSTLLTSLWEDRRRISRAREEARVRASVARAMSVATDAVYQARRVGKDAVQRERTLRNTVQLDMGRARGELASLRSVSDATAVAAAARELDMSRHVARLEEENKRLLKTQRELEGLVHSVHIREETEQQRRAEAEARVEEVWEGRKRLLAVLGEWRERARIVTGEIVRMCGDDVGLSVQVCVGDRESGDTGGSVGGEKGRKEGQHEDGREKGDAALDKDVWMQPSSMSQPNNPKKNQEDKEHKGNMHATRTSTEDSRKKSDFATTATHPFGNTVPEMNMSVDSGKSDDYPSNPRFPDAITISSIAQHIRTLLKPLVEGDLTNTTISDAIHASPGTRDTVVQSLLALRRKQALERGAKCDDAMATLMSKREKRNVKRRTRRGESDTGFLSTNTSTGTGVDVGASTDLSSAHDAHDVLGKPVPGGDVVGVRAAVAMLEAIAERQWNDEVTVQLRGTRAGAGAVLGAGAGAGVGVGAGAGAGSVAAPSANIDSGDDEAIGTQDAMSVLMGTGIGASMDKDMGAGVVAIPSDRGRLSAGVFMRATPTQTQDTSTGPYTQAHTHVHAETGTDVLVKSNDGAGDASTAPAAGGGGLGGDQPSSSSSSSSSATSTSASTTSTGTSRGGVGAAGPRLVLRASTRQRDVLAAAGSADTAADPKSGAGMSPHTGTGTYAGAGMGTGTSPGPGVAVGVRVDVRSGMGTGVDAGKDKGMGMGKDGGPQQSVWDHIDGLPIPPPDTILSR